MHIVFLIPIATLLFAICTAFLVSLCLLASWLALGRSALVVRMPLFLTVSFVQGCVVGMVASRELSLVMAAIIGTGIIASSFVPNHWIARSGLFLVGSAIIFVNAAANSASPEMETSWIVRVTLVNAAVATVLSVLRWLDFRLIQLIQDVDRELLDTSTGRSLDEWFTLLDRHGAELLNHAQIRGLLRGEGLDDRWQKSIAEAHEKSSGRRKLIDTETGQGLFVDRSQLTWRALLSRWHQQRFTIRQMMLASFGVACLAAFVRWFPRYQPQWIELAAGIPIIFGLSTISIGSYMACLTPTAMRPWRHLLCAAALILVMFIVFQSIGLALVYQLWISLLAGLLLATMTLLAALLMALRHRGYRLARVTIR